MAVNELLKIVGVGVITVIFYIIVKPLKPELAMFISIAGGCLMFVLCIDYIKNIITTLNGFIEKTGLNNGVFSLILKIVGIGYLSELAANLCNDVGNSAISEKILLAGKIAIVALSLPIVSNLLNIVIEILP